MSLNLTSAELRTLCPEYDDFDYVILDNVSYWVEGVAQSSLATLGVIGNLFSCFILTRRRLRRNGGGGSRSFNLLLVTLAAFDSFYLFGAFLESLRNSFDLATDFHVVLFPQFLYPAHSMAMTGSIFMTVAIAFERYSAVHFPMDYSQVWRKYKSVQKYTRVKWFITGDFWELGSKNKTTFSCVPLLCKTIS